MVTVSRVLAFLAVFSHMGVYKLQLMIPHACPQCRPDRPRATIIDPILSREWELRYER